MNEVTVSERLSGNVFIRDVRLPKKGDAIEGHTHNYDHTMFFMSGKAKLTLHSIDGKEDRIINAPADMLVAKDIRHEITAMTNDVYFCCVFPHRGIDGTVTDQPETREAYI